jgi:hypothetical protein
MVAGQIQDEVNALIREMDKEEIKPIPELDQVPLVENPESINAGPPPQSPVLRPR